MSRPRSPHYSHRMSPRRYEDRGDSCSQRFPWDDPNFDPERVLADLDKLPWGEVPEDLKALREHLMEEIHPGAQRRPPRSPGRHHHRPGHHHLPPEEYHTHRRSLSPPPHEPGYGELGRFSPKQLLRERDGGGGGGGLREELGRFEERERPSRSPQRLPRERLPSVAHTHQADPQHRDPSAGWGREEQTRGQGRSRERFHNQGRGGGRGGGGEPCGPFEDRRREDLQRERSPHSDRYEREAEFRERHRSLERGPGERRDEPWGGFSQRGGRAWGPLVVEHDHGMMNDSGGPPRREPFEDRRDRGSSRERLRYRAGSSQERFRKSNIREGARGHPVVHDGRRDPGHEARRSSPVHPEGRNSPSHRDARRSPIYHERTIPIGLPPGREGPVDHRGRSSQAHRGRGNPSRGGRMDSGPSRNQPHPQPFPHGRPHSPQQQRQSVRPREPDWDVDSREEEPPGWVQEPHSAPRWEKDRQRGRGRPHLGGRMDPAMPRGREQNPHWNETQTLNVEETLTIKVDMNCRVGQNSQLCYSSDRQLSLDLVNVGRQRLDFLPMLEHSGTYRENAMHSGTFAQEIISLVHKVKEHYFKGDGITLNQRFSGPQEGGLTVEGDEEEEELAEEERPTLNRRFNMNMKMKVPDTKPLFSSVGRVQPHQRQQLMNDPGDLRHDLERRRQEKLEGVKVTIPGGNLSQRPLGPGREQHEEYMSEEEVMMPLEEDEVSGWSGEQDQGRRWDGHMGQSRGALFRPNASTMRRNYRPQNRPGNRRNANGPNW